MPDDHRTRAQMRRAALALAFVAGVSSAAAVAVGATDASSAYAARHELTGKIVFTREVRGYSEIFVMAGDGGSQTRLTVDPSGWDNYSPDWSPDGTRIAFASQFGDNDPQIYVMNADGTGRRKLTTRLEGHGGPDWSPDGTKVAFGFARPANNQGGIAVISADGTNETDLTNSAAIDGSPAWSPDGRKIAFERYFGTNGEIFVMDADGSSPTNLTNSALSDSGPAWSPDGAKIAFSTESLSCCGQIFAMNADGSGKTALGNAPRGAYGPAWSPDGSRIASFTGLFTDGPRPEIFVMNADGGSRSNLTRNPASDESPDWHAGPLKRPCVVPRVVGRTLRTARTTIRRANCSVGRVRYASSTRRRGRVIGQSLRPGARRAPGAPVNLVVSRGR